MLLNRLPLPTPAHCPPSPTQAHLALSVKDLALAVAKGNQAFYSIPVTGLVGVRSGVTTNPGLWKPPPDPPFAQSGVGVGCISVAFSPKLSWVAWSPGSWELPGLQLRVIGGLLWPWPFQRTIASMQGKIPSPRVQVSKELLGPQLSLQWALRSRCSCLACFPLLAVFVFNPRLPSCLAPANAWELRGKK